jgi:ketosteroid isomerase-like protein
MSSEPRSQSGLTKDAFEGFVAFSRGDWKAILAFLSPDCKWEENQAMGFPGLDRVYYGHEGLRKWVQDTREVWEAIKSEPEDIIEVPTEADPSVVVVTRLSGQGRQEIHVGMLVYNVFWSRTGKAVRRRIYFDRDEAFAQAALSDQQIETADADAHADS